MAAVDTKTKKVYLPRPPPKVYLQTINPHITCAICDGYLIDATTVDECLHSFCRSCLIQHIRTGTHCPVENCGTVINKVKPNIKLDTTLQAIVYKLVPGLYEKEILCRRAFYRLRKEEAQQATPEQRGDDTEHLIFGPNENISLMLEYSDNDHSYRSSDDENSDSGSELKATNANSDDEIDSQLRVPKYLQCPAIFRISNLKKFVMHKFGIDSNKFCVEIMYKVKTIALPDYYTLMDVAYIYTWKRDAPMKFFYCVRAATKENVALPNVDNLLRPSAEYINAKNAYLESLRNRDIDHDQSSDADSDMRSESGVSSTAAAPAPEAVDASSSRAVNGNGNASAGTSAGETRASSAPATKPTSSSTTSPANTAATTTASSTRNTSTSVSTTVTSNGGDASQTQRARIPLASEIDASADRTPTGRPAATSSEAAQRLSATPSQASSPHNAPDSSTKTNGNDKSVDAVSTSPSSSRSNFDVEMTREKVKIKIVSIKSDTGGPKVVSGTTPEASIRPPQTSSPPASTSSPRSTSTVSKNDIAEPPPAPVKSKFLLSKDKDAKPKTAANAEAEYDFDQHLLEEKMTEKNQFLKSIHLAPRTAAEMLANKSPSKIEPKIDQPTDLSKDVKPSTTSASANAASTVPVPSPAASLTKNATSTSPPAARTSSPQAQTPIDVDRDPLRRPEIKASKRKSREPVKNVTKLKCPPPTSGDSSWLQNAAASHNNGGNRSPLPPPTTSLLASANRQQHSDRDRLSDATLKDMAYNMSQQNKILLKQQQQRQSTFKAPATSESSSGGGGGGRDAIKSTESETSIIINNVQRPNQADTPRPPIAFNHNWSSFFQHPSSETEIKEIRNDDAMKEKVYGPTMTSHDDPPKNQHMKSVAAGWKRSQSNQNEPLHMNAPSFLPFHHGHANQDTHKKSKSNSGSPAPIDMKRKLNSTGELEVTTTSGGGKPNSMPKRQSEPSVHTWLHNCNITLPSSLSVTLTNDEIESSRSFSSQTKTPINNSIEIVKLPDESSSSPSPAADQMRNAKGAANSPGLLGRSENSHAGGSASPVAINLVNNKATSSQTAAKQRSGSSTAPGPSNASFQAKYIQSLDRLAPMQLLKPKKEISKPNPMPAPAAVSIPSRLDRSPTRRKPSLNGPKPSMQLPYQIPSRSMADNWPLMVMPSSSSSSPSPSSKSDLLSQFAASSLSQLHYLARHQSAGSRTSGGSGSSGISAASKTSYPSIPRSSKPI